MKQPDPPTNGDIATEVHLFFHLLSRVLDTREELDLLLLTRQAKKIETLGFHPVIFTKVKCVGAAKVIISNPQPSIVPGDEARSATA